MKIMRRSAWIACGALLAFAAGCATISNPETGRQETVLNTQMEVLLGNMAQQQMGLTSLKMGQVADLQVERVQRIGAVVARASDRQDVQYRFGVVGEKELNAFALPGGTIYVNSGLAEMATDDELACVLGHELGHVAARHAVKQMQADIGFSVLAGIASRSGANGGAVQVANSLYGLISNGYSRQDELQADRLGIKYSARSGYNPEAMVTFFEKMLKENPEGEASGAALWTRTHPLTSDRIAKAKKELESLKMGGGTQ